MKSLLSLTVITLLFTYNTHAKKGEMFEVRKAACAEKSVGDACTFQGKKGEKSGTCKEGKRDKEVLFCKGERGKKGGQFGMLKELNLSKEQFAKLKTFRESEKAKREERKPLKDKIKSLKEDIKKGFISNISDEKMLTIHREISTVRAKIEELRFSKMVALKNILNEEQRTKFMELDEKRKEKFKKRRGMRKEKSEQ
ncbi:Spy/CpxP family protein refolding chaperone [Halobacteriovorax sp.]|uniref:Spy/CpxP family protein refolding chaperone n=1 Tax=Halobacteriovorax sp. TaxID=2020862 RepID=UPI00356B165C